MFESIKKTGEEMGFATFLELGLFLVIFGVTSAFWAYATEASGENATLGIMIAFLFILITMDFWIHLFGEVWPRMNNKWLSYVMIGTTMPAILLLFYSEYMWILPKLAIVWACCLMIDILWPYIIKFKKGKAYKRKE